MKPVRCWAALVAAGLLLTTTFSLRAAEPARRHFVVLVDDSIPSLGRAADQTEWVNLGKALALTDSWLRAECGNGAPSATVDSYLVGPASEEKATASHAPMLRPQAHDESCSQWLNWSYADCPLPKGLLATRNNELAERLGTCVIPSANVAERGSASFAFAGPALVLDEWTGREVTSVDFILVSAAEVRDQDQAPMASSPRLMRELLKDRYSFAPLAVDNSLRTSVGAWRLYHLGLSWKEVTGLGGPNAPASKTYVSRVWDGEKLTWDTAATAEFRIPAPSAGSLLEVVQYETPDHKIRSWCPDTPIRRCLADRAPVRISVAEALTLPAVEASPAPIAYEIRARLRARIGTDAQPLGPWFFGDLPLSASVEFSPWGTSLQTGAQLARWPLPTALPKGATEPVVREYGDYWVRWFAWFCLALVAVFVSARVLVKRRATKELEECQKLVPKVSEWGPRVVALDVPEPEVATLTVASQWQITELEVVVNGVPFEATTRSAGSNVAVRLPVHWKSKLRAKPNHPLSVELRFTAAGPLRTESLRIADPRELSFETGAAAETPYQLRDAYQIASRPVSVLVELAGRYEWWQRPAAPQLHFQTATGDVARVQLEDPLCQDGTRATICYRLLDVPSTTGVTVALTSATAVEVRDVERAEARVTFGSCLVTLLAGWDGAWSVVQCERCQRSNSMASTDDELVLDAPLEFKVLDRAEELRLPAHVDLSRSARLPFSLTGTSDAPSVGQRTSCTLRGAWGESGVSLAVNVGVRRTSLNLLVIDYGTSATAAVRTASRECWTLELARARLPDPTGREQSFVEMTGSEDALFLPSDLAVQRHDHAPPFKPVPPWNISGNLDRNSLIVPPAGVHYTSGRFDFIRGLKENIEANEVTTTLNSRVNVDMLLRGALRGVRLYSDACEATRDREPHALVACTVPNGLGAVCRERVIASMSDAYGGRDIPLVCEADAVAVYFAEKHIAKLKGRHRLLVYDMGAGTLDISVVELDCNDGAINTVTTLARTGYPLGSRRVDEFLRAACDVPPQEADKLRLLNINIEKAKIQWDGVSPIQVQDVPQPIALSQRPDWRSYWSRITSLPVWLWRAAVEARPLDGAQSWLVLSGRGVELGHGALAAAVESQLRDVIGDHAPFSAEKVKDLKAAVALGAASAMLLRNTQFWDLCWHSTALVTVTGGYVQVWAPKPESQAVDGSRVDAPQYWRVPHCSEIPKERAAILEYCELYGTKLLGPDRAPKEVRCRTNWEVRVGTSWEQLTC